MRRSVALVLALCLAGCREAPGPAVIGYAFPDWGRNVVVVARDEIARTARPGDPEIRIVWDSAGFDDPAGAEVARAARIAGHPGVVAVVGHGGSRGTLLAWPLYREAGLPLVVPTGTSELLQALGPEVFTLAPSERVEAERLAGFVASADGVASATIFFEQDEYGDGLRRHLEPELTRRGIRVLEVVSTTRASDFETVAAASAARAVPDAVILATRTEAAGRLARAFERAAPGRLYVAADGVEAGPGLLDWAGAAARSMHVAQFWDPARPDSLSREFRQRYFALTGEWPRAPNAMRRDAVMAVVGAIREAGPDPAAVAGFLRSLGRTRPPLPGVTGPIAFGGTQAGRLVILPAAAERDPAERAAEGPPDA
ncbi:MAG: ABC transporter substrate-binding protein [Gemmatimonadota bacterium]|nr:ABC transporter substrate-binding protein [Gemmatimonadota bacterium]